MPPQPPPLVVGLGPTLVLPPLHPLARAPTCRPARLHSDTTDQHTVTACGSRGHTTLACSCSCSSNLALSAHDHFPPVNLVRLCAHPILGSRCLAAQMLCQHPTGLAQMVSNELPATCSMCCAAETGYPHSHTHLVHPQGDLMAGSQVSGSGCAVCTRPCAQVHPI